MASTSKQTDFEKYESIEEYENIVIKRKVDLVVERLCTNSKDMHRLTQDFVHNNHCYKLDNLDPNTFVNSKKATEYTKLLVEGLPKIDNDFLSDLENHGVPSSIVNLFEGITKMTDKAISVLGTSIIEGPKDDKDKLMKAFISMGYGDLAIDVANPMEAEDTEQSNESDKSNDSD